MSVYSFEGKTLEEATLKAEEELGASREDLSIEVVEEKEKGLLGISWGKKVTIKVGAATGGGKSVSGNDADMAAIATGAIKDLIRMSGLEGQVETKETFDEIIINVLLEEKDESLFIGRRGKNLEAYQYLINKIVDSTTSSKGKRIVIDCAEYRSRRRSKLEAMARKAAHTVKTEQKNYSFPPMQAGERRIIHMTLKEEGLKTESRGTGDEKRVIVYPGNPM